jgi:D-alanine-D-alanine ligase
MNKKINVAILFGGKSAEHEVSLQSAKNVFEAIDRKKYNVIFIGIDKTGKWLLNDGSKILLNSENPKLIKLNRKSEPVALVPQSSGRISSLTKDENNLKIDVVFPILHGPFGEDGTVQGLLKFSNC